MRHVPRTACDKADRTGTGTRSVFGHQMRFDLNEGFPLVTTKKVHLKSHHPRAAVVPARRRQHALAAGTRRDDLGRMGSATTATWARCTACSGAAGRRPTAATSTRSRRWCRQLKTNPDSRRIIVSAWNVADLSKMALAPCHAFFQFYVARQRRQAALSCQLYQRSADIFLGVPFNIASYALLTHMMAQQCDLDVGDFIWTGGDCHIYSNHHEQVRAAAERASRIPYPTLDIKRKPASIFDYAFEDFEVLDYQHHPRSRRRWRCERRGHGTSSSLIAARGAQRRHRRRTAACPGACPEDLAHFQQQITLGTPVVMGRKTWDSLPPRFRPLPGAATSSSRATPPGQAAGAEVGRLARRGAGRCAGDADEVFVIGGAQLYAQALPRAQRAAVHRDRPSLRRRHALSRLEPRRTSPRCGAAITTRDMAGPTSVRCTSAAPR